MQSSIGLTWSRSSRLASCGLCMFSKLESFKLLLSGSVKLLTIHTVNFFSVCVSQNPFQLLINKNSDGYGNETLQNYFK